MPEPTLKKVQLVINKMTREQYSDLSARGEISPDQLYLLPEDEEKAIQEQVDAIEEKIPAAATPENQLADKAFVNSSINNYSAFYLTKNANGDAFQTHEELTSATKFWNAGVEKTPTKNDYLVVLQDETKTTALGVDPTTRYTYQGEWPTGQFEFQYIVNNTALTQEQVDAINSGITKSIVDSMVIPSTTHPGAAAAADNADNAATAGMAQTAENANTANFAQNAEFANNSNYAQNADTASTALTANTALTAETALTADKVSNYSETLLSGLTEDDVPVSFYILTKN